MIAASEKQTGKKEYWQTELKSLGIDPKRENDLNSTYELESLTDNIKQSMFQDYKTAYTLQEDNPNEGSNLNQRADYLF